jgi:hypothetical protein
MGGAQGVADAEAHAVMLGEMDFHEDGGGLAFYFVQQSL